ncbi:hypothetical protein ACWEK5_50795 [Rhodococcus koreensis]
MTHLLDEGRRAELDAPPAIDASLGRTPLTWLSFGPTTAGLPRCNAEVDKLASFKLQATSKPPSSTSATSSAYASLTT